MAEDDIVFEQAMQGVRRIQKTSITPARPTSLKKHTLRADIRNRATRSSGTDEQVATAYQPEGTSGQCNVAGAEQLFFLRQGLQNKVLRDLKRGKRYLIDRVVDLHGLTQIKAQAVIHQAIVELPTDKLSCILVIHGKGLRSAQGPVLKEFTADYLKTLPQVKAYCSAQAHDGGTGALYVLLRL